MECACDLVPKQCETVLTGRQNPSRDINIDDEDACSLLYHVFDL